MEKNRARIIFLIVVTIFIIESTIFLIIILKKEDKISHLNIMLDGYERSEEAMRKQFLESDTFYATISGKINDNDIIVNGMEVNDINYRVEFYIKINPYTKIFWEWYEIEASELDIVDNIAITLDKTELSYYFDRITNILKIHVLNYE